MALKYGFYNSLAGDRVYDAIDVSSLMKGVIDDGVLETIGTKLVPVAYSGMIIKVGIGKAWFNDTWTYNDTDLQLTVTAAHPTLPRIDTVILEVDTSLAVRANDIKILAGTPASSPAAPTLTNTSTQHQYPLANIAVAAGVTVINTGDITVLVGTVDTPYAVILGMSDLETDIADVNTNLSNAKYDKRFIEFVLSSNNDNLAVGDGQGQFTFLVPEEFDGWKIVGAHACVYTPSTSGTPTFQLHNVTDAVDILSTKITIDINEYSSYSAATPPVINTSNNTLATGDRIRFDCDVSGTGTKGYGQLLILQKP